ncbi:MAG TPA: hypothetical protein VLF71_02535 [Candidatus Saccharimonadales bacterium]|nr:hypothetical protein [Candidatus Saccharimonadales bacterium]
MNERQRQPIVGHYGPWGVGGEVANGALLDEVFAGYLAAQAPAYHDNLLTQADRLAAHSTPAFREMTRAEVGVGMLVSHQEWRGVGRALDCYTSQRRPPRQRIVGCHNWPPFANERDVAQTREVLDTFIAHNPSVPFAYCEGEETGLLRIGRLRKFVTDLALKMTVWRTHGDIMLTNHDADMVRLHPDNLRASHDAFSHPPAGLPFVSITQQVSHERSPNLPNMNQVLDWTDDARVVALASNYYEPGPCWSARAYMEEPFDPTDRYLETHNMLDRHHQGDARLHPARLWLPHVPQVLSPRRPYYKLYVNASRGSVAFWDGQEEDFTMEDDYREHTAHDFGYWSDIADIARDEQLWYTGWRTLKDAAVAQVQRHPDADPMFTLGRCFSRLQKLRRELGGPPGMFRDHLEEVAKHLRIVFPNGASGG